MSRSRELAELATAYDSGGSFAFRNRIINGQMMIDQRNAGASVTNVAGLLFPVDRFSIYGDVSSKFTAQQSSVAPAGFKNSVLITSLSSYSVGASEVFSLSQFIEGFNVADLGWGTANASAITLSFWVRSSLTGTFGGALQNEANARSYPFSFTVNSANTMEYKTVTISGDTTGTWLTNNGTGIKVRFNLGAGSSKSGTAGTWAGADYRSATGATNVVGTSGATFYITGVQLEKGSTATSFDYRPYGAELALCQRYYEKSFPVNTAPSAANFLGSIVGNNSGGSGAGCDAYSRFIIPFKVQKCKSPTLYTYSGSSVGQLRYQRNTGATVDGLNGGGGATESSAYVVGNYAGSGSNADIRSVSFDYVADAEL